MAWVSGRGVSWAICKLGGGVTWAIWSDLGNPLAAKIIIQMVIGRCKVRSFTGLFLA